MRIYMHMMCVHMAYVYIHKVFARLDTTWCTLVRFFLFLMWAARQNSLTHRQRRCGTFLSHTHRDGVILSSASYLSWCMSELSCDAQLNCVCVTQLNCVSLSQLTNSLYEWVLSYFSWYMSELSCDVRSWCVSVLCVTTHPLITTHSHNTLTHVRHDSLTHERDTGVSCDTQHTHTCVSQLTHTWVTHHNALTHVCESCDTTP